MPYVKIEMFAGRTQGQKNNLIQAVTEAVVAETGCDPSLVWVVIDEKDKDNFGIGGRAVSATD